MSENLWCIGFTGSRNGISRFQKTTLAMMLTELEHFECEFRHGGCVGGDFEAHRLTVRYPSVRVIIHPGPNSPLRAPCNDAFSVLPDKDYGERNADIATHANRLIACPDTYEEILNSGTWQTIRFARQRKIPITIIFPDGSTKDENL